MLHIHTPESLEHTMLHIHTPQSLEHTMLHILCVPPKAVTEARIQRLCVCVSVQCPFDLVLLVIW